MFKLVIFLFGAIAIVASDDPKVPLPPVPPANSTEIPTTTSTVSPTTPSTTTPKTPTTTSTVPPTTPSTTTPKPPTTSTSTVPPTTPTTPKTPPTTKSTTETPTTPTTTAAPNVTTTAKPIPSPKVGIWLINSTQNASETCLVAQFAAQIEIPYLRTDNTIDHAHLDIPIDANATGSCGNFTDTLQLQWTENNSSADSITFIFGKGNSTFNLSSIIIQVTPDEKNFPGHKSSDVITLHNINSTFSTPLKHSYKCAKEQTLNLTSSGNATNTIAFIHISHTQLQAFYNSKWKAFGDAVNCEAFDTPDVVPIAIGCALAALVIIVLIAYLVQRRRSQARGYLSM